jgi:hypothetical protein
VKRKHRKKINTERNKMQKRQNKVHISGLLFLLHPRQNPPFHGLAHNNYLHPLLLMTVKYCKGMMVKNKYQ